MKALHQLTTDDFIEMAKLIDNEFKGNAKIIVHPIKKGIVRVTGHTQGKQCINCDVMFDIHKDKLNGVFNQNNDPDRGGAFYHVYPPTLKRVIDYLEANEFDYCPNTNITGTVLKTLILLLLPLFSFSQDTLPAILKVKERNFHKYVKGYVVLTKDCNAVEFLRVNTWRRKERLLPFKGKVVDWRLITTKK